MTQQDSTIANADLWTKYFHDQWSPWLGPLAGQDAAAVAAATGARIASFLTLVAAGPIAWLYANNAPNVTPIRAAVRVPDAGHDLESVEEHAA
jgi:hypothetical protein